MKYLLAPALFSLLATLSFAACGTDDTEAASLCGDTMQLDIDDAQFCVATSAIVIETGFTCPRMLPYAHEFAGCLVCSLDEEVSDELLQRVTDMYYQRAGEEPLCEPVEEIPGDGLDNDCDGEVDEQVQPIPCTSDGECGEGQYCLDAVCVAE